MTVQNKTIGNSGRPQVEPLSPLQHEVCSILMEECCELGKAASKLQRAGCGFVASGGLTTTRQDFSQEVGDVLLLIEEARAAGLVDKKYLARTLRNKPKKLRTWTDHLGHVTPPATA